MKSHIQQGKWREAVRVWLGFFGVFGFFIEAIIQWAETLKMCENHPTANVQFVCIHSLTNWLSKRAKRLYKFNSIQFNFISFFFSCKNSMLFISFCTKSPTNQSHIFYFSYNDCVRLCACFSSAQQAACDTRTSKAETQNIQCVGVIGWKTIHCYRFLKWWNDVGKYVKRKQVSMQINEFDWKLACFPHK